MKTLSDLLHGLAESIAEIEQRCRDIHENKNLADIVGMARAKIAQAAQHPDALGTTAAAFVGEEPAPEGLQPVPPPLADGGLPGVPPFDPMGAPLNPEAAPAPLAPPPMPE